VLFLRTQEVSSSNFVFAGAYLVSSKKGLKRNDERRSVVVESGEGSSNFGLQGMGSSLLRGAIVSRALEDVRCCCTTTSLCTHELVEMLDTRLG
jgi:hypothetical protein